MSPDETPTDGSQGTPPRGGGRARFAVIPGVDTVSGLRRMSGNAELYASVLRMFIDGHRNDAEEIRREAAAGDWNAAVRRAHTVKGLAGTIGADALQEQARAMEACLKQPETRGSAEAAIAAFAAGLAAVTAGIEAALPSPARPVAADARPVDPARLGQACRELQAFLATDDLSAQECLERHRELLQAAFGARADAIAAAVEGFDFAAARRALAEACAAQGIAAGAPGA